MHEILKTCAKSRLSWLSEKQSIVLDFGQWALLCENMTSSTKPNVHNLLQCGQREPSHNNHF